MQYTHGGDIYSFDMPMIDFSSNINPLGMPDSVKRAAIEGVSISDKYPDALCRSLRAKISKKYNVPFDAVVCGNGGADIIYSAVLAVMPKRVLIAVPAFSEYECACDAVGAEKKFYYMKPENNFDVGCDMLDGINGVDAVFMCSPNNPTGRLVPKRLMCAAAEKCRDTGAYFFADESFMDFVPDADDFTLLGSINKNTVVIRSFTKMYAMPGLRLGFAVCGSAELAEKIEKCRQPWSVSAPAQKAGIAALDEDAFVKKSAEYAARERKFLTDFFDSAGIKYIKSSADYVLFRSVNNLDKMLLKYGILIRSCENYRGLDSQTYRIAVKSRRDNERLVSAIGEIVGSD